jgi:hypothetical protein
MKQNCTALKWYCNRSLENNFPDRIESAQWHDQWGLEVRRVTVAVGTLTGHLFSGWHMGTGSPSTNSPFSARPYLQCSGPMQKHGNWGQVTATVPFSTSEDENQADLQQVEGYDITPTHPQLWLSVWHLERVLHLTGHWDTKVWAHIYKVMDAYHPAHRIGEQGAREVLKAGLTLQIANNRLCQGCGHWTSRLWFVSLIPGAFYLSIPNLKRNERQTMTA